MSPRVGQSRRRDANEPGIVQALQQVGRRVIRHSGPGEPDLFVERVDGLWVALEVKSAKGRRTKAQATSQYPIIRTREEALAAVGIR